MIISSHALDRSSISDTGLTNSTEMLSAGSEEEEIHLTMLRASKELPKSWRAEASKSEQKTLVNGVGSDGGVRGEGRGHPRVWLIGDAVHAMQPFRYVSFEEPCHCDVFLL